jgi:hypothetical protein
LNLIGLENVRWYNKKRMKTEDPFLVAVRGTREGRTSKPRQIKRLLVMSSPKKKMCSL